MDTEALDVGGSGKECGRGGAYVGGAAAAAVVEAVGRGGEVALVGGGRSSFA